MIKLKELETLAALNMSAEDIKIWFSATDEEMEPFKEVILKKQQETHQAIKRIKLKKALSGEKDFIKELDTAYSSKEVPKQYLTELEVQRIIEADSIDN